MEPHFKASLAHNRTFHELCPDDLPVESSLIRRLLDHKDVGQRRDDSGQADHKSVGQPQSDSGQNRREESPTGSVVHFLCRFSPGRESVRDVGMLCGDDAQGRGGPFGSKI